ncbi:hypothetical protein [Pseudomonas sp. BBP2017]|uniref:hypothetical protein n=1 Tax=Pseudomonas sp. BBP2017 TaxID=2109731 RepID=UPI000D129DEC|nr:hypothetical protein [Pseudomonas sp. BBP2017]PSS59213.1 hypothetical protein C6382_02325 [Pseudomonas sp. BBP2017]
MDQGMHQVVVIDETVVHVEQLVKALRSHHIVVLNCIMRGTAQKLQKDAELMMKNWSHEGPDVYYNEFEIKIEGERWFAPTMTHSELNDLNLTDTWNLVQRAMEIWVARGRANHFIYTNRTRDTQPSE